MSLELLLPSADATLRCSYSTATVFTALAQSRGFVVRIIATTNSDTLKFDPAMLRPGRLIANVEVAPLRGSDVERVGQRLVPAKTDWPAEATLAQVYALAREAGWTPTETYDLTPRQAARLRSAPVVTLQSEDAWYPAPLHEDRRVPFVRRSR